MHKQCYKLSAEEVENKLQTDSNHGLSNREVQERLARYGKNKLAEEEKESLWHKFSRQFEDFMVIILMITIVISALLGEVVDAVAILAIVILNAVLGFVQEYRAEKSLSALKQLTAPLSQVIRAGKHLVINATEIVPGDIIVVEAGDRVPVDARIISSSSLYADEATLTGESLPVEKNPDLINRDELSLGDQHNMLFMGTLITRGRGHAVAVATGMDTEIGKIAGMIQDSLETETPLQKRLQVLGKWLVWVCLGIVALVFVTGVWRGFPVYRMFLTGISLAVAAIPEGLPAVVTIALAVGVQKMIRCNAIVRKLPAVETLGCATVICSDKTGTLTQNRMHVQKYWVDGSEITTTDLKTFRKSSNQSQLLQQALLIGLLCNNAEVDSDQKNIVGDPTEIALVLAAKSAQLNKQDLAAQYKTLREIPFDSDRKRMSVVVKHQEHLYSYVKGAPGLIIDRCSKIMTKNGIQQLTATRKRELNQAVDAFGREALRVLGLAYRQLATLAASEETLESELIFVGIVGMIDPPRPQAKKAISLAKKASIRTIMVTGDHQITATAIANQLNLGNGNPFVLTGLEWDRLSEVEQLQAVKQVDVFARVAPQHKLSIVRSLQKNGEIVGMTGDGVNDAPAVKEANIGISMGITGTDVTKEASDMVLADDNYATIIAAIREGRVIYDNIRKFIRYLLGCNVGEVLTMFFTTLAGLPLPMIPIQILWMNLVTDGLPAVALSMDPGDDDIMDRPPRAAHESIFARRLHLQIGMTGLIISICTVAVFILSLMQNPDDINKARTLAFTTIVMAQLIYVFQCRSEYHSIFRVGLFSNLYLVVAVFISAGMHILVVYHPWFQKIFSTVAMTRADWIVVLFFAAATLILDTVVRVVRREIRPHFSWLKVRT